MSFGYGYASDIEIRLYLFCITYDQSNKFDWLDQRTAQELQAAEGSPALSKQTIFLGTSSSPLGQIGHEYGEFSESLGMAVPVSELQGGSEGYLGYDCKQACIHQAPIITEQIAHLGCMHLFSSLLAVDISPFWCLVVLVSLSISYNR